MNDKRAGKGEKIERLADMLRRSTARSRDMPMSFSGETLSGAWPVLSSLVDVRERTCSLPDMARRMKASRQVVARLERSIVLAESHPAFRKPSLEMLQRYAEALGLRVRLAICDRHGNSVDLDQHVAPTTTLNSPHPRPARARAKPRS
jgi:hypothetical protein